MTRRSAPKGASPSPAAKAGPCPDRSGLRFEYCVRWRRLDWLPSTCDRRRIFATLNAAQAFSGKLYSNGRPDLSPPARVRIERRYVSDWEPWL